MSTTSSQPARSGFEPQNVERGGALTSRARLDRFGDLVDLLCLFDLLEEARAETA